MDSTALSLSIARKAAGLLAAAAFAVSVAGCSGGSGGGDLTGTTGCSDASPAECGSVLLAVTDAEGDFVSYSVDVLSVALQRAGGAQIELLPASTRLDFAQLTDLTDLISAAAVPPGDYTAGTIRLDYGNAEVFVESGGEIVPAQVVDANGEPLGIVELEIRLPALDHLVVTRARTALLALDFDLAASHSVDLTQTPAVVTAQPYIVAEVRPVEEKEMRLRGPLVAVDVAAASYTIDLRPWHLRDGRHGRVTVHTTAQTTFEIADEGYVGEAGLRALADQPAGTLTVAFGTVDVTNRDFTAEIVHAGESVGGDRIDAVHGNIVARDGNRLTVKGAFAVRRDRDARFHRTVLVDLGAQTTVVKMGVPGEVLDENALSIGQRIVAFGDFSEPAVAGELPVLDATQSRVRMLVTRLHGSVNGILPGQLSMQLRAIDRLGIDLFDFSGTGITPALDADPSDYEIATGTLSLSAAEVAAPAKVLGFVRPFGAAPADFEGRTVIDHRDLRAALGIGWGSEGTAAPFLTLDAGGFVLDLTNPSIGERHHLVVGGHAIELLDLPTWPTVIPQSAGRKLFGLVEPGHVELFTSFDAFVAELTLRLGAGATLQALAAYGAYDASNGTLAANRIAVHVNPVQ